MIIEEFKNLQTKIDEKNPFSNLYYLDTGESFYIEPIFYTQLKGFKEQFPEKFELIINKLLDIVKQKKKVVFTGNYEAPLTQVEGYFYLEVTDVTDQLKIYAEDKSRGSDYGD